jgi:hypothetical protein
MHLARRQSTVTACVVTCYQGVSFRLGDDRWRRAHRMRRHPLGGHVGLGDQVTAGIEKF